MLAPPWISIPPPAYGGIEAVVALLSDELVRRGNSVTLFCAPGSRSNATIEPLLDEPHLDSIGAALFESDHVSAAFAAIDAQRAAGRPFDVVHDHSGFTALAMADRLATPLVHTLHGEFNPDTARFYTRHGAKAALVAISRSQLLSAPSGLEAARVIPNPIAVRDWPLRAQKDGYLLWIGRMAEIKGPHRAIAAARRAKLPIVLAGPVQPGQEAFFASQVEPQLDGRQSSYIGEVGGRAKQELFSRARALLMPIRWAEPFGMVMVEALACGTPVISFPEGAANEIVVDGVNGFLVADEAEMARAIGQLSDIDPRSCRASVADRFDVSSVATAYEAVYRETAAARAGQDGAGLAPAPASANGHPANRDLAAGAPFAGV